MPSIYGEFIAIALKKALISRTSLTALLFACVAFAGCAQAPSKDESRRFCFKALRSSSCVTAPGASPEEKSAVRTLSGAPHGGRFVIVRHQWPDLQGVADLTIDGKMVQRMTPSSAIAVDLQPGKYVVSVDPADVNGSVSLDITSGQVIAIELRKTSWNPRRFVVRELEQDAALAAVRDSTILGIFSFER